jgi:DnaJ-class molecular chaperone
VNPGATNAEIERAFRAKAKAFHPDMHHGKQVSTQRFREIVKAREALLGKARA